MVQLNQLLLNVIKASEKSANIARRVRAEKTLFDLLIEEKTGKTKNDRFVRDFKTLADVLIQETIKHDLCQAHPTLEGHIHGEEDNKFCNQLGETVCIEVQSDATKTGALLGQVLESKAAELLAQEVHTVIKPTINVEFDLEVDEHNLGLWIDPIDSTAQYIKGINGDADQYNIVQKGLQCVTVLIGVYERSSGLPIAGVINQPFSKLTESGRWEGAIFWGASVGSFSANNIPKQLPEDAPLLISGSESTQLRDALLRAHTLTTASGAGYKALCVIQGHAKAYVLTQGSTYKWDTCGPQAILNSLGGGLLDLSTTKQTLLGNNALMVEPGALGKAAVRYHAPDCDSADDGHLWANKGGILAYVDGGIVQNIVKSLP